ncbi:MAG: HAMP domain-containing protein [Desulfobacterales bacterium]|nr:HAMP domain-containing protein [Desulfobacterales bacterium]
MVIISIIFVAVLSIITVMNLITLNKAVEKSERDIWSSLIKKGSTLTYNNSLSLPLMMWNIDETAICHLVSSTVRDDEDIVYGIVMDPQYIPLANASNNNPSGIPQNREPLKDKASMWAGSLKNSNYKTFINNKEEVIEFAAPVIFIEKDKLLGFIRYGLSTKSIHKAIYEVKKDGNNARNQMILILSFLCIFSLYFSYIIIKKVANRISQPINELVESARTITKGNYNIPVNVKSNDEIGNLSENFEMMRATIKKYTDHLQDLVDEKMQQVNDILNNIEQGLFTINLDGSVNKEYSARANEILKVSDISSCKIEDIFRLDSAQKQVFDTWLKLVREKHLKQRWHKLTKISPIQNLELEAAGKDHKDYISISYEKIFDKNNNLSKIMILALDVTEKRLKELQMIEERKKHLNEMKIILSIAATHPEEIYEFLEDSNTRLKRFKESINEQKIISDEKFESLYRDMHTIKGNSGSYNFDLLSSYSHKIENILEELRCCDKNKTEKFVVNINEYLNKIEQSIEEINQKASILYGRGDEMMVRIPKGYINKILNLCTDITLSPQSDKVKELTQKCIMLSWKPLKTFAKKYQKTITKFAKQINKDIEFIIKNEQTLQPEDIFKNIDEALIHIFRNAVAHGIEIKSIRKQKGKGIGNITFEVIDQNNNKIFIISDDGNGIDIDKIVLNCIKKGIITKEESEKLTDKEKLELIYLPYSTTVDEITDLAGRGFGMNVVLQTVKNLCGTILIDSVLGERTTFTITIPYN